MTITQLKVLEHDPTNYKGYNSLLKIDDTHAILAYCATDDYKGYIKTFGLDANYELIEIDSRQFDSFMGRYPSLKKIDDTHYIVAYSGKDYSGMILVFEIDASYNISFLDSDKHDYEETRHHNIFKINDTQLVVAYAATHSNVSVICIKTISIDPDNGYVITILHSEELSFPNTFFTFAQIDISNYALLINSNSRLYIKTYEIYPFNFTELETFIDTLFYGDEFSAILIDENHLVIAFEDEYENDGYVATFEIDSSYAVTMVDSYRHDSDYNSGNSILKLDSTHFALACCGKDYDGYLKIFEIDASYNILAPQSIEHDLERGIYNSLIQIDSSHLMLAYAGAAGIDGFVKTFETDVYDSSGTTINITINISPSTAQWKDGTEGTWNDSSAEVELSEGSHTVIFSDVSGYVTPDDLVVNLSEDTELSVYYYKEYTLADLYFPSYLNSYLIDSYSYNQLSNEIVNTKMETGRQRLRQRSKKTPVSFNVSFIFDQDQLSAFEYFNQKILLSRTLRFNISLKTGSTQQLFNTRYIAVPQISVIGTQKYKVDCQFESVNR